MSLHISVLKVWGGLTGQCVYTDHSELTFIECLDRFKCLDILDSLDKLEFLDRLDFFCQTGVS